MGFGSGWYLVYGWSERVSVGGGVIASLHADGYWAVLIHFVDNKIQETYTLVVH